MVHRRHRGTGQICEKPKKESQRTPDNVAFSVAVPTVLETLTLSLVSSMCHAEDRYVQSTMAIVASSVPYTLTTQV
jgi:hypothetical protein